MRAEPVGSRLFTQTILEHERCLPQAGEVLVAVGDTVHSNDTIARCEVRGSLRLVDASGALGIPRDQLARCLRVEPGQRVRAGDVLAANGFMGWRAVRTPVSGRVAEVTAGRIFVQEPQRTTELKAHLPGQVVRILPGRGAVIRATVSRVVGIWSTGGECFGPLMLRSETASDTLNWIGIDLACRGRIVVGGQCLDRRVLLRAVRFRARGLIVGGLAEHLRPKAKELGLPVMVTDGLSSMPMAEPFFSLLAEHEGHDALLAGGAGERTSLPALSIPLPSTRGPVNVAPERPLTVGDRVRLARAPLLGTTGWVKEILAQGSEAWVEVELEQGSPINVPYQNLERLD